MVKPMQEVMEWYAALVGSDAVNAVAERAKLVQSTLNRQIRAGVLSVESVAAIARAYDADVLDALVIQGIITPEDIRRHGIRATLSMTSDLDIAAEVMRRLGEGRHPILDAPLG